MSVEFSVTLQDRPGTLARLGQMLGEAAVISKRSRGRAARATPLSTSFREIRSRRLGSWTRLDSDTPSVKY